MAEEFVAASELNRHVIHRRVERDEARGENRLLRIPFFLSESDEGVAIQSQMRSDAARNDFVEMAGLE